MAVTVRGPLPRYVIPSSDGRALRSAPPFPFEGMTARVFPLRAKLDSLRRFCDNYLNIIPPELGRFRPAAPYVHLQILNYGRMAVQAENLGWFAQREIVFNVPVEWYRWQRGRWIFQDWATVAPFIFVDHTLSMTMGRMVYGWPKAVARLQSTDSAWMDDPAAPLTYATLSTTVFPELYRRRRLEEKVFLEIDVDPAPSNLQIPFDSRTPLAPWSIAANVARSVGGFARDWGGFLEALGIVPMHWGSDAINALGRLGRIGEWMYPLGRDSVANTLNLKQFRLSEDPDEYCFQALTNGPMRFTAIHRAGFLGEQKLFLGSPSGGYTIRLHRWPSLPIFETLGLEASATWDGSGCRVSELEPVVPFWFDANMEYLQGYNIAWRPGDAIWRDRRGRQYPTGRKGPLRPADRQFNTTLGAYNKALVGPFRFSGATVRVLPLLAHRAALDKLLNRYINKAVEETGYRFRLWASGPASPDGCPDPPAPAGAILGGGDDPPAADVAHAPYGYVYMAVTAYGEVESGTNNVGDWASLEVAFLVPVLREEYHDANACWETCGVGLLPVAVYVDDVAAVGAGAEVLGMPSIQARFGRPPIVWLSDEPGEMRSPQQLLRLGAQVLPAFGEGQEAKMRTVIEITEGNVLDALQESQQEVAAANWARILIGELERMDATAKSDGGLAFNRARALSLELLNSKESVSYLTIKQLRDIEEADAACYQSLVAVPRQLREIHNISELPRDIVVTIHETPSHPLVSTLGLVAMNTRGLGSGLAYVMQPIRPFELSLDIFEGLGRRLVHRSGSDKWEHENGRKQGRGRPYFCGEGQICIELKLPRPIGVGDPADLGTVTVLSSDRKQVSMDKYKGRSSVRRIDPQMVIESLLAREWGKTNPEWLKSKAKLEAWLESLASGRTVGERRSSEAKLIDQEIARIVSRPGAGRVKSPIEGRALEAFKRWSAALARFEKKLLDSSGDAHGFGPSVFADRVTAGAGMSPEMVEVYFNAIAALQKDIEALEDWGLKDELIFGMPSDLVPEATAARLRRIKELVARLKPRFPTP